MAAVATQLAAMPCLPIRGPKSTMSVNEASGSSQAGPSNSLASIRSTGSYVNP